MPSFNLLLSSNAYNKSTGELVYRLPSGASFSGLECCINTMTMYNSFTNISSEYGNNTITLRYPIFTAANVYTMQSYVCTLATGHYSFEALNNALDDFCLKNGLYLVDSTGKIVVFQNITENPVTYKIELTTYYLPTSAQAAALGMSNPGGLAILNAGNKQVSAQVQVTLSDQQRLTGFAVGTYPPTGLESVAPTWSNTPAYTGFSSTTGEVNRVNAVTVACNCVQNPYSIPDSLLALVPVTSRYGAAFVFNPSNSMWSACPNTMLQEIKIQFYDQEMNRLYLVDSELSLTLSFRDRK